MIVPVKSFKTTTIYPIGPKVKKQRAGKDSIFNPVGKQRLGKGSRSDPVEKNTRMVNVFIAGVNHRFEEEEYIKRVKSIVQPQIPNLYVFTESYEGFESTTYEDEDPIAKLENTVTVLVYLLLSFNFHRIYEVHGHVKLSNETKMIPTNRLLSDCFGTLLTIFLQYKEIQGCSPVIFKMLKIELFKYRNQWDYFRTEDLNIFTTIIYIFMSVFPYLVKYFSWIFITEPACIRGKKTDGLRKHDTAIFLNFYRIMQASDQKELRMDINFFTDLRDFVTVNKFKQIVQSNKEMNNFLFIFGSAHVNSLKKKLSYLELDKGNIDLNIDTFITSEKEESGPDVITNKTILFFGGTRVRQSRRRINQRKTDYEKNNYYEKT